MTERIAVFVAWPYANGPLHIGHLGGSLLPPDVFARFHRLRGAEVMMVSGSDTHGTPITVRAETEGRSPVEVYRHWHGNFLETFEQLGISFDLFTHTDTANHHRIARDLFLRLLENGALFLGKQPQLYAPSQGRYLPDRFVEGICPYCGYESARGDQCDGCGRLLNATELLQPRARFGSGERLEIHEREHYFLDLPRFAEALERWLESRTDWRSTVRSMSLGQIREGLTPRAITRDLDWGIPVPLPGWEDKVLYVWFEAVMGYLTASIEWAELRGTPDAWRDYWYDPESRSYYFMGKDNTPFHTIIWPAMLMGARQLYPNGRTTPLNLPTDVVANEYVNLEGEPMSTSRNWALWLPDYLSRYAADPLRYYLTANAPETRDVDFTWQDFVKANNNELLATWGNLVNRVLQLALNRTQGRVPAPGDLDESDQKILEQAQAAFDVVAAGYGGRRFKLALADAMALAHEVNRYLNARAPWNEDDDRCATTLYVALQCIDWLKVLLAPVLPESSQRLHHYLGYDGQLFGRLYVDRVGQGSDEHLVLRYDDTAATGRWQAAPLPVGMSLREPAPLYTKLDAAKVVAEERARLAQQIAER